MKRKLKSLIYHIRFIEIVRNKLGNALAVAGSFPFAKVFTKPLKEAKLLSKAERWDNEPTVPPERIGHVSKNSDLVNTKSYICNG